MAWEREAVQEVLGHSSLPQAFHRAWDSMSRKALLHTPVQRTMMEMCGQYWWWKAASGGPGHTSVMLWQ